MCEGANADDVVMVTTTIIKSIDSTNSFIFIL
jgi:hypothetical protein